MIRSGPSSRYLLLVTGALICVWSVLPTLHAQAPDAWRPDSRTHAGGAGPQRAVGDPAAQRLAQTVVTAPEQASRTPCAADTAAAPAELAASLVDWVRRAGVDPGVLGLPPEPGVTFVMQLDTQAIRRQALERYRDSVLSELRARGISVQILGQRPDRIRFGFPTAELREQASAVVQSMGQALQSHSSTSAGTYPLEISLSEEKGTQLQAEGVQRATAVLRRRAMGLGFSQQAIEPQSDGLIVLRLAGERELDRGRKLAELIGMQAVVGIYQVAERDAVTEPVSRKQRPPADTRVFKDAGGDPVWVHKRPVVASESIANAVHILDPATSSHGIRITLDEAAAKRWHTFTNNHIGGYAAVVYESVVSGMETTNGAAVQVNKRADKLLSVARIMGPLGRDFQITGLDDPEEAQHLALLLRAGPLPVPVRIVEERAAVDLGRDGPQQDCHRG